MSRDTLFQQDNSPSAFAFTSEVAEVFDDMLDRSVPGYRSLIPMMGQLLVRLCPGGSRVYDLGCSTGTTCLELNRRLEPLKLEFIGIDNSAPMLTKARIKAEMSCQQQNISFLKGDITEIELAPCSAIIVNYTLQFIKPDQRPAFLNKLYQALQPGGLIIISEKIIHPDPDIDRVWTEIYHQYKKNRGYSQTEIARKRKSLENVLIPLSLDDNLSLLEGTGFHQPAPFWQWFNFTAISAIKKSP